MKLSVDSGLHFDAQKTRFLQAGNSTGIATAFFYAQTSPPSEETWV